MPPPPRRPNLLGSDSDSESETVPVRKPATKPLKPPTFTPAAASSPPAPAEDTPTAADDDEDDDEDDYLSMCIPEPTVLQETLTQRMKRQQRESEIRGRPKSKAELAREAAEKRDAALAQSLLSAENARQSKGLKMMQKMGFTVGKGLGKEKEGEKEDMRKLEPVGVQLKQDKAGIGHTSEVKRRMEEAAEGEGAPKRREVDPEEYRQRVAEEREEKRLQGQFFGAQKVLEGFEGGEERKQTLRGINVLWRGLVKHREEAERERRMRYDMEQGLGAPKLPGYDRDYELDAEDKTALGIEPAVKVERTEKGRTYIVDPEEDEGEDEELAEFEELPWAEKLERITGWLREKHNYCFWCKWKYDTAEMDGCPGTDEDSHG
ncbi:hypothetical protein FPQ18DRAFT_12835 [Pyronema domesticum]|uniref:G-patch domain-containing protein n=1 Tax=Pyronema omphalodes (strain CBS 100304) TaxID=1076935 RepID=U4LMY9_PYROM|nr:hypothetical protein FPQ18DRAFT_12835 [Pyronema domesticum]CCX32952.1 Similar to hypothetical protein [Tuber melanosporum Mel28]; acc. no. XP_002839558 [Pyronema omphalodes CBS 100304]